MNHEQHPGLSSPRTSGTTDGLPVAPSLSPALAAVDARRRRSGIDRRVVLISALAIGVALASGAVASVLTKLIGAITNLAFYGRMDTSFASPAGHHLGAWVIAIPIVGGIIVGLMARFGSSAIRGHGIPEAMEQVLFNESRIPARMTFLKPISAAISIGTGGPFGAEGPIIATGGALGSLVGQIVKTSADERKTLLAAGAAAGMAATFGSPVSAVLLAIELLLFEYRARSVIPVALATVVATGVRFALSGSAPVFPMPDLAAPGPLALLAYVAIGALVGIASVGVTRLVYAIEDGFERLPIHWMWWPAIGGLAVGVVGYLSPKTLGVGYDNIERIVSGDLVGTSMIVLCTMKLISWSLSLGSGTSGGTLAPLFTIGSGLGGALALFVTAVVPGLAVDIRVGALVGMAAMFAGASRALLASVVFAFETTRQPMGLLPLLGGCTGAYLVSCLLMDNTIMTEKIVRRGRQVPSDYAADYLDSVLVADRMASAVVTLSAKDSVRAARAFLKSNMTSLTHQGFPVIDGGMVVGVLTRRELARGDLQDDTPLRDLLGGPAVAVYETSSLREAADVMARENVGRIPVLSAAEGGRLVGILTRSDILGAHRARLAAATHTAPPRA